VSENPEADVAGLHADLGLAALRPHNLLLGVTRLCIRLVSYFSDFG
jgi:hypothetical protein